MPMYEFHCRDCDERFEELRSVHDPDEGVECPQCGGSRVERLLSAFATSGPFGSSAGGSSCGPRGFS